MYLKALLPCKWTRCLWRLPRRLWFIILISLTIWLAFQKSSNNKKNKILKNQNRMKKILFWNSFRSFKDYSFGTGHLPFVRAGCKVSGETIIIRPSHTLRCSTPTTECTKAPAIYENSMRCSAMHFPTCWKFCSRWRHTSAIYCPILKRFSA